MLVALKILFAELTSESTGESEAVQQQRLRMAVAGLLHEMMRVDFRQTPDEARTATEALTTMFGLSEGDAQGLLVQAGSQRLTSYFDPASIIKRLLSLDQRAILVENLWRVAFADGELDVYEDQFVRKVAALLNVSNTECMLARGRARNAVTEEP